MRERAAARAYRGHKDMVFWRRFCSAEITLDSAVKGERPEGLVHQQDRVTRRPRHPTRCRWPRKLARIARKILSRLQAHKFQHLHPGVIFPWPTLQLGTKPTFRST